MTVCVGLDVGTTGVKAIAVDATGAVVARSESGYLLSTPRAGWTGLSSRSDVMPRRAG